MEQGNERTLALFLGIALVLGIAFDVVAGDGQRPK